MFKVPVFSVYTPCMTIELNEQEVNIILEGLSELPAKKVFSMILKFQSEWAKQSAHAQGEKKES